MKQFSLGSAWSRGIAFVSSNAVNMAILLIGIGVIAPAVVQFALVGSAMAVNPAMIGQSAFEGTAATLAASALAAMLAAYVLQFASYFGAWRLGFGEAEGETLGGAIVYGLVAATVVIGLFAVLGMLIALVAGLGGGAGAAMALAMLILVPVLLIMVAILYPVMMAVICVALFLFTLIALAFGTALTGTANPAFSAIGGGFAAMLIFLAVDALVFWLAARLSCVTSAMASRKTYDPLVGIVESWRVTAANQWRIMGYLALIGVVGLVILVVAGLFMGASMLAGLQPGEVPEVGIGAVVAGLVVGIPVAYAFVLIPAGIYRELGGSADPARVFA